MSASDAAPLPRLGEVFFDVRGNSRSMRLSWYADTGVAVFSIWQGGRCTGTFRLPIDDLPRMIEILQRGPDRRRPRLQAADRSPGSYAAEAEPAGVDQAGYGRPDAQADPYSAADQHDNTAGRYDAAGGADSYERADSYETAAYPRAEREPRDAVARGSRAGARRPGGHGDGQPYADSPAGYGESQSGYSDSSQRYSESSREYQDVPGGYQDSAAGYEDPPDSHHRSPGGFWDSADYDRPAARGRESHRYAAPADYRGQAESQSGDFWQDERDDYRSHSPSLEGPADSHLGGYGQDRFVPPYVQSQGEAYPNDNEGTRAGHRGSAGRAAYPADRSEDFPDADWHADQAWSDGSYSGGSDYRLAADPPPGPRHSAGRSDDR